MQGQAMKRDALAHSGIDATSHTSEKILIFKRESFNAMATS